MEILGTEGVADEQGGRKPGGVVNGSVCKVKKAETGLMYMSVSRPRVSQGPMSLPRVERSKGMLHFATVGVSMNPPAQEFSTLCSFSTSKVRFRYEDKTPLSSRRWIFLFVMIVVIIHLTLIVWASNASIRGGECIDIIG